MKTTIALLSLIAIAVLTGCNDNKKKSNPPAHQPDNRPFISITSYAEVAEGDEVTIEITADRPVNKSMIIKFNRHGSAVWMEDYTLSNAAVYTNGVTRAIIYSGQMSTSITITPREDQVVEGPEIVAFTLKEDCSYRLTSYDANETTMICEIEDRMLPEVVFTQSLEQVYHPDAEEAHLIGEVSINTSEDDPDGGYWVVPFAVMSDVLIEGSDFSLGEHIVIMDKERRDGTKYGEVWMTGATNACVGEEFHLRLLEGPDYAVGDEYRTTVEFPQCRSIHSKTKGE